MNTIHIYLCVYHTHTYTYMYTCAHIQYTYAHMCHMHTNICMHMHIYNTHVNMCLLHMYAACKYLTHTNTCTHRVSIMLLICSVIIASCLVTSGHEPANKSVSSSLSYCQLAIANHLRFELTENFSHCHILLAGMSLCRTS